MKKQARCNQYCSSCTLANKEEALCFQAGQLYETIEDFKKKVFKHFLEGIEEFGDLEHVTAGAISYANDSIADIVDGRFGNMS